jgi:hypothetical protein
MVKFTPNEIKPSRFKFMYITISRCEDEPRFNILSEAELKIRLKNEYADYEFLESCPPNFEEFPNNSIYIVKGDVIIPKPEWEL